MRILSGHHGHHGRLEPRGLRNPGLARRTALTLHSSGQADGADL